MNRNFEDYSKMIYAIAWKFAKNCNLEVDLLVSEAFIRFTICEKRWKPNEACSFRTYLYSDVYGHFKNMFKRQGFEAATFTSPKAENGSTITAINFWMIFKSLSDDAKFCADIIFHTPAELYDWLVTEQTRPKHTKKHLKRYLNKVQSWPRSRIVNAFNEITNALK